MKAMKRGFTILELLVASLLLGMLMTILTMIFNQSSISWRIGEASVADLDDVSDGIATVRYEADNLYAWNGQNYALLSPWDENGNLRTRAISATGAGNVSQNEQISRLSVSINETTKPGSWGTVGVGSGDSGSGTDVYTVNVMSAGPNRTFNDWDDIWSFPDEFD